MMIIEVMLHHFLENAKYILHQKYTKNAIVTLLAT